MMRAALLVCCLCLHVLYTHAQELIPFDFVSEEENKLIKENDTVKFYIASGDTSNIVCLNEEGSYYKLIDHEQRVVLAEGSYIIDGDKYLQTGKWIERYNNGRVKNTGYYQRNKPNGTWLEYYMTGRPKTVSNYTIVVNEKGVTSYCLTGTWMEYYANGKLKVTGHYIANETKVTDTLTVEDPITDQKMQKVSSRNEHVPAKAGTWEYYSDNGELDKKEEI